MMSSFNALEVASMFQDGSIDDFVVSFAGGLMADTDGGFGVEESVSD